MVACSDIQMAALKQARAARAIAEDPELSDGIPMEDSLAPVPAHASKKQSEIGATLVGPLKRFRRSIADDNSTDPAVKYLKGFHQDKPGPAQSFAAHEAFFNRVDNPCSKLLQKERLLRAQVSDAIREQ